MTLQEYLQGLAKVTSALVGDKLSVAKGSNPIPSVYIERQKPPKPFYPYATTDYIGKGKYGSRELYSAFNEDTNTHDTFFNRRLRLRVAFYGMYEHNILDIAEELEMRMRSDRGAELLELYMPNAGLMGVSEPTLNSNVITNEFEEFTFITIDFWVISKVSDSNFYYITEAPVEGELYQYSYDQEEEPLTITTEYKQSD